ncbi:MAG: SMI1/KNR4 family protein [Planctomycetota bacterium]|nr:SMI1/KNR4 family protein [Planctomycetota bacterium]
MAKAKSESSSSPKKAKSSSSKSTRTKRVASDKATKSSSKSQRTKRSQSTDAPTDEDKGGEDGVPVADAKEIKEANELDFAEQLAIAKGTTAKAIITARIAVHAIASERTTETRAAQKEANADDEDRQKIDRKAINAAKRSSKDLFKNFRSNYLKHDPSDPFSDWRQLNERSRHELGEGCSVDDMQTAERRLKRTFPPSYWDFCLEWGSGLLFTSNWRETYFIDATNVLKETKSRLLHLFDPRYLPIARLGPNDYLALDTRAENDDGEFSIVWWNDQPEEAAVKVADSFADWLEQAESSFGDHYWLAE